MIRWWILSELNQANEQARMKGPALQLTDLDAHRKVVAWSHSRRESPAGHLATADPASSADSIKALIDSFSHPVMIINSETSTILAGNLTAIKASGWQNLNHRPVSRVLRHQQMVEDDNRVAYFDYSWKLIRRTSFMWENMLCEMVSLRENPLLPDAAQIESARDMSAVLLHRFRSPLTGMLGYLDLMLDENESDPKQRHLRRIGNGMEQLNDMLEELERLHLKQVPKDAEPLYPEALVSKVASELPEEQQKRLRVLRNDKTRSRRGKRNDYLTMIDALLKNAFEHASGHGKEVLVDLQTPGRITITNHGKPIPDFLKKRMFLPFMTDKAQNMGIGLTLAHLLSRQNGSSIYLTSNCEQEGISFSILMPPPPDHAS